jgi:secreted Zn-dependent insulinase-like peptidase
MANCASLDFSVGVSKDSVTFLWSGFNDVMPEYIQSSLQMLIEMENADLNQIFDQVKEDTLIGMQNSFL